MRRSTIWLVIAIFWLAIAAVSAFHHDWKQSGLQAAISLIFFYVYIVFRRKETVR